MKVYTVYYSIVSVGGKYLGKCSVVIAESKEIAISLVRANHKAEIAVINVKVNDITPGVVGTFSIY